MNSFSGYLLVLLYCTVALTTAAKSKTLKVHKNDTKQGKRKILMNSHLSKSKKNTTSHKRGDAIHFYLRSGTPNVVDDVNNSPLDISDGVHGGFNTAGGESFGGVVGEQGLEFAGHQFHPTLSVDDSDLGNSQHLGSPNNIFQENTNLFNGLDNLHNGLEEHNVGEHEHFPLPVNLNQHVFDGHAQHIYKPGKQITNGVIEHIPPHPPVHIMRGPQIILHTKPEHVNVHLHTYDKVGEYLKRRKY